MTRLEQLMTWAARNEITEALIYRQVASQIGNGKNREILTQIAEQEEAHHRYWSEELSRKVGPNRIKVAWYVFLFRLFGISFALKLLERGEARAIQLYEELGKTKPRAVEIMKEEQAHEQRLLDLIDEYRLQYVSSFVLGLNDALVELTGALAGLTLALRNTRLIAIVGLITGIAATMAMAASEYLSTREEEGRDALKAGMITGVAYFFTVLCLVTPFFLVANPFLALVGTMIVAAVVILLFTFYTAVAKGYSFKKRFLEMAAISFSVAIVNFGIGYLIREYFGI